MAINYGVNKVRFPAPVPVGIAGARDSGRRGRRGAGGVQVTRGGTVEREGGDKPVCVAEIVFRLLPLEE